MRLQGSCFSLGTSILGVVSIFTWLSAAGFTNSFDYATSGSDITLTWDAVDPHYYPLFITAQVIDKDAEGSKATGYRTNITVGVTGNSFKWTGIPYPARWIPAGLYQLELRTATWNNNEPVVLAKSSFFRILEQPDEGSSPQPTQPPNPVNIPDNKNGGSESSVNKPLAIGLGVSFGVPALVTLAIFGWCLRRRRQKARIASQRLKRSEFIID
ncbi:hypothetical protein V8F20_000535 [Naviculisporaceae sp. PSN 640]